MADIKDPILKRLSNAAMTPEDLEKPGAHVLVTDGEDLHVMIKDTKANRAIDKLEAEVPGYRGKLDVTEEAKLELGELGEWRDFVVSGLSGERLRELAEQSATLAIFSPNQPGEVPPFYASVDLAFAMMEVIGRGVLAVRPIAPGERDGKLFIEVSPKERRVIHQLTKRWVDDTIPVETRYRAAEAFRQLQAEVYDTGVIGPLTLGLTPARPDAPKPKVDEVEEQPGRLGLSGETIAHLAEREIEVPDKKLSIPWLEETIDRMKGAPDRVIMELREALGRANEAREQSTADMFSVDVAPKQDQPTEIVYEGARSQMQERADAMSVLAQGTEGLGVDPEVMKQLAETLSIAANPKKLPGLVLIAGPKGSPAQPVLDLVVDYLGKKPLRIQGSDLAEPGWAVLFGHNRGFPTEGDAWLSQANIEAHRDSAADPAPIVFENLKAAGSGDAEDKTHHQRDLMTRIAEWADKGFVNVYAKKGRGAAKQTEVPLAGVAFVVRWDGPAKEFRDLLSGTPELAHLAEQVAALEPYTPKHAVNDLIRRVTFDVRQHFGPKGCTLDLDARTREGLEKAFKQLGPARALDLFFPRMSRDVADAIKGQPATKYTIGWSSRLTTAEKGGLETGEPPELATARWFGAKAG